MTEVDSGESILAIVTTHPEGIRGGGAPVFVAEDNDQLERMSLLLSRVMMGATHEIDEGTMVIVRH